MHGTGDRVGDACEARGEGVHAEVEGVVDPAGEHRLVDLDVDAAGVDQGTHLGIDGDGQVGDEGRPIPVVPVDDAVGDGQRPGDRDLDGMVGRRLGDPPVVGQEGLCGDDRADDHRKDHRQHAAHCLLGTVLEVEAGEVPAVVVDVVLAPHLAVGDHVDSGVDLSGDHLGGRPGEEGLRLVAGGLHLVRPTGGVVPVGQVEPVGHRHVVGLRKGAHDRGGQAGFHAPRTVVPTGRREQACARLKP